ncbi:hypothetical protein POTOM_003192 [Populus tomentosa]|uniref:Pectinesterase catalytic domain-containing protein n=1 Tax=Populus tomentosa TaxID=118781 RepID=A0A8X8DL62_POPTO|nr:hypothetical protein POTOM_003192 [Populus tomentosa]
MNHDTQSCMDPNVMEAKVVVSSCGHDGPFGATGVKRLKSIGTIVSVPGMNALDMNAAEDAIERLPREIVPGMIVTSMEVNHDGKIDPGFDFKNERTSPAVVASLSASDTDIVQPLKRWKWEYTTFQEAVNLAPDKSKRRFVIYVKSWIYEEKVEVAKKNKNGMIAGEGPEKQQAVALIARKPAANRKNMVTAQGRIDPNQNTGISIQNCAGVSKRVNQPGYHVITDPNEAKQFTVAELIQGEAWLESTGVSFTQGL